MGSKSSSEANGVRCNNCNMDLPANKWKFDLVCGWYCFYDEVSQAKVYKYARKNERELMYYDFRCIQLRQSNVYESLHLGLAGHGAIYISSRDN